MGRPFEFFLTEELTRIEECASAVEEMLRAKRAEISKEADSDQDEDEAYATDQALERWTFPEGIPGLLRRAMFVVAEGHLEHALYSISHQLMGEREALLKVGDLSGKGVTVVKDYFKKVLKLPFPSESPLWTELLELSKVRNVLIHCDGWLSARHGDVRKYVSAHPEQLELGDRDRLVLKEPFVPYAIGRYQAFLRLLVEGLPAEPDLSRIDAAAMSALIKRLREATPDTPEADRDG